MGKWEISTAPNGKIDPSVTVGSEVGKGVNFFRSSRDSGGECLGKRSK